MLQNTGEEEVLAKEDSAKYFQEVVAYGELGVWILKMSSFALKGLSLSSGSVTQKLKKKKNHM